MHTVTFYSFKGGVGRTLSLVNIGVELAKSGRKVLLVDFDLEAPGIDTFSELEPPQPCCGIVDYVEEYLTSGTAPEFGRFHYKALETENDTGLWIMPAGRRDSSYATKLAAIDWPELYRQRDGFLLMEHLKAQWREKLAPDYVLIDSRTGHTEVGGICTRQLPDTVVVLFIPNEQNLEGVSSIVDSIREESAHRAGEVGATEINLEFVASNVPSLDDEYQILRKMMRRFEHRLVKDASRRRPSILTINRYDSMHLLNQTIFVTERPQSRLSRQYRRLMERIVEHNLEDREAALRVISRRFPRPTHSRQLALRAADFELVITHDAETSIHNVLSHHGNDAEINFMIGQLHKSRGDLDEAELFFGRAAKLAREQADSNYSKYQLELLETSINKGNIDDATSALLEVISRDLKDDEFQQAIGLISRIEKHPPEELAELQTLKSISPNRLDQVVWMLCTDRSWQKFAVELYKNMESANTLMDSLDNLTLATIGTKNYELLLEALDKQRVLSSDDIQLCFNFAMADWGASSQPAQELFAHVVELDPNCRVDSANYEQCIALSLAVIGQTAKATKRLDKSREIAGRFAPTIFSCWRYERVDLQTFLNDLAEIENFASGNAVVPEFMR